LRPTTVPAAAREYSSAPVAYKPITTGSTLQLQQLVPNSCGCRSVQWWRPSSTRRPRGKRA